MYGLEVTVAACHTAPQSVPGPEKHYLIISLLSEDLKKKEREREGEKKNTQKRAQAHIWLRTTTKKIALWGRKNVQTYFTKPQFISEYFYSCFVHTTDSCVYKTGLSRFNLTPPNEKVIFSNTDFLAANIWSTLSCLCRYKWCHACCGLKPWSYSTKLGFRRRLLRDQKEITQLFICQLYL